MFTLSFPYFCGVFQRGVDPCQKGFKADFGEYMYSIPLILPEGSGGGSIHPRIPSYCTPHVSVTDIRQNQRVSFTGVLYLTFCSDASLQVTIGHLPLQHAVCIITFPSLFPYFYELFFASALVL